MLIAQVIRNQKHTSCAYPNAGAPYGYMAMQAAIVPEQMFPIMHRKIKSVKIAKFYISQVRDFLF